MGAEKVVPALHTLIEDAESDLPDGLRNILYEGCQEGPSGVPSQRPEIRLQSAPLHHNTTTTNGAWTTTTDTYRRPEVLSDYEPAFSLDRRSPDTGCWAAPCSPRLSCAKELGVLPTKRGAVS
jgi:hypothetical protein